jgi:hypothetical protein
VAVASFLGFPPTAGSPRLHYFGCRSAKFCWRESKAL